MKNYQWYFGEREPEDRREAKAQILAGICGFVLFCTIGVMIAALWLTGVI